MKSYNKRKKCKLTIISCIIIILLIINPNLTDKLGLLLCALAFCVGFVSVPYGFIVYFMSCTALLSLYGSQARADSMASLNFNDVAVMAAIGLITAWISKKVKSKNLTVNRSFFMATFFFLGTLGISIIVANVRWGQPIIRSIIGFRMYLGLLIVFPLSEWFEKNEGSVDMLMDVFSNLCVFSCLLCCIQYFVFPNNIFLSINYTKYGLHIPFFGGQKRYLLHQVSPWLCLLGAYNYLKIRKSEGLKGINRWLTFSFILIMITLVCVAQARVFIISFIVLILLTEVVFINQKQLPIKLLSLAIIAFWGVLIFLPQINSLWEVVFSDVIEDQDEYSRFLVIDFFWGTIKNSWTLLGGGIANAAYANSPVAIASKYRYTLSDVGGFGFFYQFGVQGILGLVYYCFVILKNRFNVDIDIQILTILSIVNMLMQVVTVTPVQHFSILIFMMAAVFSKTKLNNKLAIV